MEHTRRILGGNIGVLFYDVTTLYFEADYEDDLRKTGFSKEGRHKNPQVILGLFVSIGGYPLAYCIHEGNKYEGHTMLPVVTEFVRKYALDDFIVVADSRLMNNNIADLEANGYKYIIGAKIKNESKKIKEWILEQPKHDCQMVEYEKATGNGCWSVIRMTGPARTLTIVTKAYGALRKHTGGEPLPKTISTSADTTSS